MSESETRGEEYNSPTAVPSRYWGHINIGELDVLPAMFASDAFFEDVALQKQFHGRDNIGNAVIDFFNNVTLPIPNRKCGR